MKFILLIAFLFSNHAFSEEKPNPLELVGILDNIVVLKQGDKSYRVKIDEKIGKTSLSVVLVERYSTNQIVATLSNGRVVKWHRPKYEELPPEPKKEKKAKIRRSLKEWQKLHNLKKQGIDTNSLSEDQVTEVLKNYDEIVKEPKEEKNENSESEAKQPSEEEYDEESETSEEPVEDYKDESGDRE